MRVKAKVKSITRCAPLFMEREVSGVATMGNGETMKAVLVRENGMVKYQTPEGAPLKRMVKFFDYDPPNQNLED